MNIKATGMGKVMLTATEEEYDAVLKAPKEEGMKRRSKGQPRYTTDDLRIAEEQLEAMNAAKTEAAGSASSVLDSLLASGQLNGLIADAAESKAASTYEAQKPALEATLKRKIDAEATKTNAARLLKSLKGGET